MSRPKKHRFTETVIDLGDDSVVLSLEGAGDGHLYGELGFYREYDRAGTRYTRYTRIRFRPTLHELGCVIRQIRRAAAEDRDLYEQRYAEVKSELTDQSEP